MSTAIQPSARRLRLAWALILALVLSVPAALAQKGMSKGEYFDYLVRSGQTKAPSSYSGGPTLHGAAKMLGPGDGAGGAPEGELHAIRLLRERRVEQVVANFANPALK